MQTRKDHETGRIIIPTGTIIIFHDAVEANPKLKYILSNIFKIEIAQSVFISLREQYFE